MSKLQHNNPSQLIKEPGFNPILRDEPPNVAVLNRPAKNAYEFSSLVNKVLSYNGSVSFLKSSEDPLYVDFKLYEIAEILDSETIKKVSESSPAHGRYGIILTEIDSDGYYTVCTFCPNLVFPEPHGIQVLDLASKTPSPVYIDNTQLFGIIGTRQSSSETSIGSYPIGRVTGERSIFFSGTLRSIVS